MKFRTPTVIIDKEEIKGAYVLKRTHLVYIAYAIFGFSAFGFIVNVHDQGFVRSLHHDTLGMLLCFAAVGLLLVRISGTGIQKFNVDDNGDITVLDRGKYVPLDLRRFAYVHFIKSGSRYGSVFVNKVIFYHKKPSGGGRLLRELLPVAVGPDPVMYLLYWHREGKSSEFLAPVAVCDFLCDACVKAGFTFTFDDHGIPSAGSREG